jgi:hypothetical protein
LEFSINLDIKLEIIGSLLDRTFRIHEEKAKSKISIVNLEQNSLITHMSYQNFS